MSEQEKKEFFILETKRLMEERGMSQKDLSEKSGITEASVSRYLAGKRTPRFDVVINFAKALGVKPGDLLPESEQSALSPYEELKTVFARNGKELSEEQKKELIALILGKEEDGK